MNATTQQRARPLMTVENLRTRLLTRSGYVRAVDGVSFSLNRGQTFALVGESGCGKSMLCKTLLRLLPVSAVVSPDTRIIFDGNPIHALSEKPLNRIRGKDITMIFQDPMSSLNPVMTIGDQVAEPLRHHLKMPRRAARDKTLALMAAVGIPMPHQRVHFFPHQLSGGLCQRVAIAMALAAGPKLLIADEPTTALDVTVQAEILDLLARLQTERRMAVILVTHDLGLAAGRAQEVAVMYAGKIVEQAATAALFDTPRMPYTRSLIAAIPRLDNSPHTMLATIDGHAPDLIRPPEGCRFAPRCPKVRSRCKAEDPPLRSDGDDTHRYACWYPCTGQMRSTGALRTG